MSVYVDPLFKWESRNPQAFQVGRRNGHLWCHLFADTLPELFAMAERIGMRKAWFQNKPGFPHFDLTPSRRFDALLKGAVEMRLSEFLRNTRKTANQRAGQNCQNSENNKMAKTKITRGELKTGGIFMDASEFGKLGGETFAGLNILKLAPGQAAGPFTLKTILLNQKLGEEKGEKKKKPVDVYVATDAEGTEVRMPVAASFVGKAKDAGLAVGDTFAVMRGENYKTKFDGRNGEPRGASYALKILTRAKSKK